MKPLPHPLSTWLRSADDHQRQRVAALAGTSTNYLYQIASMRREPKVTKAFAIEDAINQLSHCEQTPVTARDLAQAWVNKEKA